MVNFPLERLCQPWYSPYHAIHYAQNACKEGLLVQLAKKFLTGFYVFFKFVDFVLLQEIEPFLHLLHQSSNSIFDFNLRASFARLSFQVTIKLVEKVQHKMEGFWLFLKKSVWRADFERFLNKLFLTCKISQKRNAASFFYCIFDRQDVS